MPPGAIDHGAAAEAVLMRSQHTMPLKEQHAAFKEDADIFEDERANDECPTLQTYFTLQAFNQYHYQPIETVQCK